MRLRCHGSKLCAARATTAISTDWRTKSASVISLAEMRATTVPRCGRISISRELARRINASRTGWRETPSRVAISCSERRVPGSSSSSMIARRRSFSIDAAALSPLSAETISKVILQLAHAIDSLRQCAIRYHTIPYRMHSSVLNVQGRVGFDPPLRLPNPSRFQDNFVAPNLSDPRLASKRSYRMLIDGTSVDAQSGETVDRESPGHRGKVIGNWPAGSTVDANLAVAAARRAFDHGPWPRMSGAERSTILHRVAEHILAHVEELALIECLETGKPLGQARGEIGYCADLWTYAAGQSRGLSGETHNSIGENRLGLVL